MCFARNTWRTRCAPCRSCPAACRSHGVDIVHTATLGRPITEQLGACVKLVGISPIATGNTFTAYADTGLTFALTDDIQLDAGISVGLSERADDVKGFLGLSFRY